LKYLERSSERS